MTTQRATKSPQKAAPQPYVKPAIQDLGDMRRVTQKTGLIADQTQPNAFTPP